MRANRIALRLGAGLLVAGLGWYGLSGGGAQAPQAAAPVQRAPDPFAFVKSMEGTVPDGDVRQNPEGQLVVDAELGHLFDYYLAGLGEKDLGAIRAEIERELDRRLAPAAAAQAKRLLGSYLDYKRALADAEKTLVPSQDLANNARARLDVQRQLRPRFFSASEIAGLFGLSDAYDSDTVARLAIAQDTKLTEAERASRLAALDQRLPPALRADREAPTKVIRLEESVLKMRAQGASDDEVYRLRAATFSPEAAGRLAEVDREDAAWKSRIATYLGERARLAPDAQAALQQLRDQRFTADEQKRLGAYE